MGSVAGSVIGASVLSALPEALRPVKEYSDIIYTLILLGFLLFVPRGLATVWDRLVALVHTAIPAIRPAGRTR